MKIAKIILLALTTCLTSCYEDYTHDYETTNVGFALQNPLRTVISDRDMPIYVGVSLGGKRGYSSYTSPQRVLHIGRSGDI